MSEPSRTVLVAEDDEDVRDTTVLVLQDRGWRVCAVPDGHLALEEAVREAPDIAVLDIAMPGMDGIRLTRMLKQMGVPVVLLTARDLPSDVVTGLDAGADDYVVKPFDADVLDARLRAVLRRDTVHTTRTDTLGDLSVDHDAQIVSVAGSRVDLTATEWRMLLLLLDFRGSVLSRERIIDELWPGLGDESGRIVDTNVQRLRRKVGPDRIATVRGTGYRLELR